MGRALYGIGRFCAAHALPVVLAWIALAIGVVGVMSAVGSMTTNDLSLPGTEGQQATDLLEAKFPPQQNGSNPIVFHVTKGKVTDAANKSAIEASYHALVKEPDVYSATDPFKNAASGLVSADGRTAFIPVLLKVSNGQVTESLAQRVFDATAPAQKQGIEVAAGGTIGSALSPSPTESSEVVGLLAAMVILAITFGSFVAMGLPILTAVLGLATALGTIGLLSRVFTIPVVGPTLATMIGLGVGIDYSLFLVTKYRTHLATGVERREAIARAVATAGGAIVFAGSTVVIALMSLSVAGIPLVSALGYATAIAVFTAVTAAITLLPAVLSLLGPHVFGGKLPAFLRAKETKDTGRAGFWGRWASAVTRHRWACCLLALAILVPLIIPLFSLHLGQEDVGVSPKGTTEREAFDLMTQGFGAGYNGPLVVAVELKPAAKPSQQYESEYSQAKALQSDLQHKQGSLTDQSNQLKAQQASLLKQKQQLEAQKASLTQQKQQLLAQQLQLTNESNQLLAQKAALPQQRAQLQQEHASVEQQRAALPAQIKANLAERARLTATLGVILAAERVLEASLASHGCDADPSRTGCSRLAGLLASAQAREASTRSALAANEAALQDLKTQAVQLVQQAQQLIRDAAALVGQAASLAAQAASLQQRAFALQAEGAALQQQANAAQARAASLQQQANALQAQADDLKGQQQQAQNEQKQAIALQQQLTDELTYAGGDDRGTDPRMVKLQDALATPSGVLRVLPPTINKAGDAATFGVIPENPSGRCRHGGSRRTAAQCGHSARDPWRRLDRLRWRRHGRERRSRQQDLLKAVRGDRGRSGAEFPAAHDRVPLASDPTPGCDHEPALRRGGVRRADGHLPVGLGTRPGRVAEPLRNRPDREFCTADDVRCPVRPVDGLRGLSRQPDRAASRRRRGPQGGGPLGTRGVRQGDRRSGDHHDRCVRELHPELRPDREAVRRGAVGRGVARRHDGAAVRSRAARPVRPLDLGDARLAWEGASASRRRGENALRDEVPAPIPVPVPAHMSAGAAPSQDPPARRDGSPEPALDGQASIDPIPAGEDR